jgi:hypothetical protein
MNAAVQIKAVLRGEQAPLNPSGVTRKKRGELGRQKRVQAGRENSGPIPSRPPYPAHSRRGLGPYSHSIVPGGLLVMSSTTRPTGRISLII